MTMMATVATVAEVADTSAPGVSGANGNADQAATGLEAAALIPTPTPWQRGDPVTVTLFGGRVIEGQWWPAEDGQAIDGGRGAVPGAGAGAGAGDTVTIRIAGVLTPLSRERIWKIEARESVEDMYIRRRVSMEPTDLTGRLALAEDLMRAGANKLARRELVELTRQFPSSVKAAAKLKEAEARLSLDDPVAGAGVGVGVVPGRGSREGAGMASADQTATPSGTTRTTMDHRHRRRPGYLTEAEIDGIKRVELPRDLSDPRNRMHVPVTAMRAAFERFADDPRVPQSRIEREEWLGRPAREQVALLRDLGAAESLAQVRVLGEPTPLMDMRRVLYREYIARYFMRQFGRGQVPGLTLRPGGGPIPFYTNFYILSQYAWQDAAADAKPDTHTESTLGSDNKSAPESAPEPALMVNHLDPARSLLLQWGLPRDKAEFPAPPIRGWQPYFKSTDDAKFKAYQAIIAGLAPPATRDSQEKSQDPNSNPSPVAAIPTYGIDPDLSLPQ